MVQGSGLKLNPEPCNLNLLCNEILKPYREIVCGITLKYTAKTAFHHAKKLLDN
jgi:hypothetical protein